MRFLLKYQTNIARVLICLLGFFSIGKAQHNNPYIFNVENKLEKINFEFIDVNTTSNFLENKFKDYPNISFTLLYQNKSLGGSHISFQVNAFNIPIEQCRVQLHFAHNGQLLFMQHNLPDLARWNSLSYSNTNAPQTVWLYDGLSFILAQKLHLKEEKTDTYADVYSALNETIYLNDLKCFNDSTAYARVFLPDPLSSAQQNYGGTFQDAYTKDTAGLLIVNVNNTGSPLTINGQTYTYNGITFNVTTESYSHNYTASVLYQVFENIYISGEGNIEGYNTALTDNYNTYTTQLIFTDYNYPNLENQEVWRSIPVQYNSGQFELKNSAFEITEMSTPATSPYVTSIDTFSFTRNQIPFEDVNAFYHLNTFKAYWESLGFTDLATEVVFVDCHGNDGADNSFFAPTSPPRLIFGQGGVDDAEDADVVVHEYGHAISNFAAPGTNNGNERRAIDEGFGDYVATTYSLQLSSFLPYNVFSWDGHNEFWAGRISNSAKTADDINANQNIYYNGEIWSAVLTDLRNILGQTIADKLAIEVMYYNTNNLSMTQAALHLFEADTALFSGQHTCQIFDVLQSRKFVNGSCQNFYTGILNKEENNEIELHNVYGFSHNNETLELNINQNFKEGKASFINALGQKVNETKITETKTNLYPKNMATGFYVLLIELDGHNYSFNLVKQ